MPIGDSAADCGPVCGARWNWTHGSPYIHRLRLQANADQYSYFHVAGPRHFSLLPDTQELLVRNDGSTDGPVEDDFNFSLSKPFPRAELFIESAK